MKKILSELFKKSIELNDYVYSDKQIEKKWIGNLNTTLTEINKVELKLNVKFPNDYKNLLLISNGFLTSTDAVEPSFIPIQKVDYLKNVFPEMVRIWTENEPNGTFEKELESSLIIAGINDEQQFLLIPPIEKEGNWKYWKFANWIPGEEVYENLTEYIKGVIEFLNEEINTE
ncbi:SMI1/KNR4 family protein [Tenacibaculum finnmarkense]|uniref:SMI1/KNR4 family protein n=1 Tax=Tenacibaculum finnmarkense genomovar finnmarkense TaxID=1458503 RepID=A0AAP1WFB7_9FLAO|nr:SMI1/KNR4 family protein [Tenacibaculum finnmarkense]MBE7652120.1 SMI1/KNR4 family protein [Tenacibaculum finnmarkense genomovar finnmarkense]MBE7694165.1 SMI1/KNR4 family protein [Tenacibaculum finnmarkense genomovar finnmarkense]MCD8401634.1 SMI1/KNR4 family protein [Tenacibaculum finnmarkense genomovar finnmarkense]MCD8426337.1 SMI1/KNR4 family protein [Tenacibaculum finnmarkense genomovar finnmarkense]MCG8185654.1 SMI1/KNR4 family protein [Tenacibaculum finnmarkense genomovar finnmarken